MVTDQQYRRLLTLQRTERTMASAAAKAGMDQKTARKYRRLGKPPSQCKKARTWRTRVNIFQEVWPEVEQLLEQDQSVEAVTIMGHLCRKYGGRFKPSQVRTLQRRIKQWRASAGAPREVFFPQQHKPGRQAESNYSWSAVRTFVLPLRADLFELGDRNNLFLRVIRSFGWWITECIVGVGLSAGGTSDR